MVDALHAIETVRAELVRAQAEIERLTRERKEAVAAYEDLLNTSRLVEQDRDRWRALAGGKEQ